MTLQNFTLGTFSQGAAGGATAFESIATATPSGVSTITFSSIPGTYQHLQIRGIGRTARVATNDTMNIRINGDTASNYSFHQLYGSGSAVAAQGSATQANGEWGQMAAASATASVFGTTIIDILDYASTSKYKTIRIMTGWDNNGSGQIWLGSVLWQSTTAINSVTLYSSTTNNFATSSTFALYGIKGA